MMPNMSFPWRLCVQEFECRNFETVNISTPEGTLLVIEAATYGGEDVTKKVRWLAEGNRLYVTGGIHTKIGDPELGVPKVFRVKYFAMGALGTPIGDLLDAKNMQGCPSNVYSECVAAAPADCDTDNACVAVAVCNIFIPLPTTDSQVLAHPWYARFSDARFCADAPEFVPGFDVYMKSGSVHTTEDLPPEGSSYIYADETFTVIEVGEDRGSLKWVALLLVAVLLAGGSLGWCIKGCTDKRCTMTTGVKDEPTLYTIFEETATQSDSSQDHSPASLEAAKGSHDIIA